MPDHNQQHSRRPHYHRGRRGPDRRGPDRRPAAQQAEPVKTDHLDIEQLMREIRSRITERHGIELSNQQIQDLAARRLEAILDPRAIKPSLMDELRRASGIPAQVAAGAPHVDAAFHEASLYEAPSGFVRLMRRLLNPLLRLLFNPEALTSAFNAQTAAIKAAAVREADQRQRQSEWNALHFEILRRLVVDIARTEIDTQNLAQRTDSLSAKVDFNERRVRGLEQTPQPAAHQPRPAPRVAEPHQPQAAPEVPREGAASPEQPPVEGGADAGRRRRRRRRGRRSGAGPMREGGGPPGMGLPNPPAVDQVDQPDDGDDAADDSESDGPDDGGLVATAAPVMSSASEPAAEPVTHPAREPVVESPSTGSPEQDPDSRSDV